jgi:hypothetical protein
MASDKDWLSARRTQQALDYQVELAAFTLRHHVPFGGVDAVLCAGCESSVLWVACPQVQRLAAALGVVL